VLAPHRFKLLATVMALSALALPAATAHADASGGDIVTWLNAQRTANGIPGIAEDTAASAACARWDAGSWAGAGPAGAWAWRDAPPAYDDGPWTATNDPFERHPDELALVLAPRLATLGAAVVGVLGCATFALPGTRPAPAQDVTYTYPGDGVQDVRTSQLRDDEIQPANRFDETGPVLFAFFDGPDLDPADQAATHVTAASLTGPDGAPVAIDAKDVWAPTSSSEVRIVPRSGLAPFTTYHASVTADVTPPGGTARSFTHAWSFTTGALQNKLDLREYGDLDVPTLTLTGVFKFTVGSRAPQVTMTIAGPGTTMTQTAKSADYWTFPARFSVPLDRGVWHVCFTSGGEGTDYRPASACRDMTSFGSPQQQAPAQVQQTPITGAAPKPVTAPAKLKVSLAKGAKATWRGRVLTVSGVRCSAACALKVGATVKAVGRSYALKSLGVSRRSAGTVSVKLILSKSAAARVRRARKPRLALTIVPKGGRAVRAALAVRAAK
jgi:hypothetical protein